MTFLRLRFLPYWLSSDAITIAAATTITSTTNDDDDGDDEDGVCHSIAVRI